MAARSRSPAGLGKGGGGGEVGRTPPYTTPLPPVVLPLTTTVIILPLCHVLPCSMLLSCLYNRFAIIMFLLCFYHNVTMCLPWNAFSGGESMSFSVWGPIINILIIWRYSWLGVEQEKVKKFWCQEEVLTWWLLWVQRTRLKVICLCTCLYGVFSSTNLH